MQTVIGRQFDLVTWNEALTGNLCAHYPINSIGNPTGKEPRLEVEFSTGGGWISSKSAADITPPLQTKIYSGLRLNVPN